MPIILGIDPGTRITGYGVISTSPTIEVIDFGAIRPPADLPLPERYCILFDAIEKLLDRFKPDALAIESQFVMKNVQSTLKLGMAKGMAILAAARRKILICEYSPKQAKLAVVGTGSASKEQVQKMVQVQLRLAIAPHPEDAADALALAICHAHRSRDVRSYTGNPQIQSTAPGRRVNRRNRLQTIHPSQLLHPTSGV